MSDPIGNPSDFIKEKIKETGIKQVHLAKKLGISPQHLNKILAKNQDRSQYLPKIAEILGLEKTFVEPSAIKLSPILTDPILKSLSERGLSFEELDHSAFKSWPFNDPEDRNCFGYELVENINSQILKNDLLIFSTSLPCDITGRIGVAFIKEMAIIFTGMLKYNREAILIYNEHDCFEFKTGDQLIGVAVWLQRNIEKGLR